MRKREGEWGWGGRGCKKCIWLPVNAAVRGTRLAWHSHFMRCGGAISLASLPILMIQFKWKSWSFRQHQGLHSLRSTYTHSKYTRDYTLVWCWVLYNFLFHKIKKYNLFLVSRGKTFTWRKTNHRLRLKSEKIWTEINLKKKISILFFLSSSIRKKKQEYLLNVSSISTPLIDLVPFCFSYWFPLGQEKNYSPTSFITLTLRGKMCINVWCRRN